jgi:hypothetical protein
VWYRTPSFPSTDSSAFTAARIPSAVDGTNISFSQSKVGRHAAGAGRPQTGQSGTDMSDT